MLNCSEQYVRQPQHRMNWSAFFWHRAWVLACKEFELDQRTRRFDQQQRIRITRLQQFSASVLFSRFLRVFMASQRQRL